MTNDVQISEREREILSLVATGATNQQIALQLNISINTVKVHLRNIFSKIGVVSRTEATVYAMRNGLVPMREGGVEALVAVLPEPPEASAAEPLDAAALLIGAAQTPAPPPPHAEIVDSELSLGPPSPALDQAVAPPLAPPAAPTFRRRAWLPLIIILGGVALIASALLLRQEGTTPPSPTAIAASDPVVASTASSRWTTRAPLPVPRDHFATAAFDLQQEIYVFSGVNATGVSASIDRYDPLNDLWVSLGEKPSPVQHISAATLRGKIYVPGGEDAAGEVRDLLEIYDPRERGWSSGPALPAPRSRYTLITWDGQLYLMGGWDGQQVRDEVFIFDPDTNRWSTGPTLPTPRQRAGAAVVSGRLYLIGGEGADGLVRDSARLDPGDNSVRGWSSIAPLPRAIEAPAVVTAAGALLVFDAELREGIQYNQTSDVWQSFAVPVEAVIASSAVTIEPNIYFITGASTPQPGAVGQYQTIYTLFLP